MLNFLARAKQQQGSANSNNITVAQDLYGRFFAIDDRSVGALQIGEQKMVSFPMDLDVKSADAVVVELNRIAGFAPNGNGCTQVGEGFPSIGSVNDSECDGRHERSLNLQKKRTKPTGIPALSRLKDKLISQPFREPARETKTNGWSRHEVHSPVTSACRERHADRKGNQQVPPQRSFKRRPLKLR
jgi:hypothetical protein